MKVLIVLTSHDQLGDTGEKTGFWLEEFAAPYYALREAGAELTLASPAGGRPPLDPRSDAADAQTDATRRFHQDPDAQAQLANTAKLVEVSADDFDAVFYPGGHGPLWDLTDNPESITLIEAFMRDGKPVAAVCHAPAALTNAHRPDGSYLVAGKNVTGFANSEEDAVELSDVVPFLLENRLRERGGQYHKGDDFAPYVLVDGTLVTGQNPASSAPAAKELIGLAVLRDRRLMVADIDVRVRRVYDEPVAQDGARVLVDRIWPRGLAREKASLQEWCKEIAPSRELRRWYGHDPARFVEFARRYRCELAQPERSAALTHLGRLASRQPLTLLTATRQLEISQAEVLAELLRAPARD